MTLIRGLGILTWPVFIGALEPGPGRSLPESGGIPDRPSFAHDFATVSGKSFPRYGGALLMLVSLDAIEEPGARLRVLDFASGKDTGDGVHWPESACWSDMLGIASNFGPGRKGSFRVRVGS